MIRAFFLLTLYLSPIYQVCGQENFKLSLFNSDGLHLNNTLIARGINESLVLICKITSDDNCKNTPKLTWLLPPNHRNAVNPSVSFNTTPRPYEEVENGTSVRLVVENLQESDHGLYTCRDRANVEHVPLMVTLIIRRTFDCGKGVFCDNRCIHERYKCDGLPDCLNGLDEHTQYCGIDPCENKVRCPNGRCIPQSWCCNYSNNCTKKWDIMCCPKLDKGSPFQDFNSVANPYYVSDVFREFGDRSLNYLNNQQQYTDLNFLQTTVYAVFGCALLFMLIVTILVVVVQCKLQVRRNWQFHFLNRSRSFGNDTNHRPLNQEVDIVDMVVERCNQGNSNPNQEQPHRNPASLLVTYNINNGVQIVGKPVEPPPYSAVASLPPQNQGPPPPYLPSSSEGDDAPSPRRDNRKPRRGLTKLQTTSEPTLTYLN